MPPDRAGGADRLSAIVAGAELAALDGEREAMWLDVIAKIEEVYSDLLRYETELETKNAQLEEAQAFISGVIESVSDVLVVVAADGTILQVNPAFVRLSGMTESTLLGSDLAKWLTEADRSAAAELTHPAGEPRDREVRFLTAGGESDVMALASAPRFDHAGRRAGAVLTGRPIGELRRAYEALHRAHQELQQAQRKLIEQEKMASLGRLVAGVAHELNNPISFVYGNIHALARYRNRLTGYFAALADGGDPAALRREFRIDALIADLSPLIDGTLEGAERISDIVRNLRHLSFARAGERQAVDLERVVRTAAAWASKAKGEHARIIIKAPSDAVVVGQEGRLHQVIVNLMENALDAVRGRPDPQVIIEVAANSEQVELRVRDNGPGIPADAADKIFEPFFTTKTIGEGTGLGLWISYSIAREHGGELVMVPCASGAEFLLRLPRAPASTDEAA